jgi:hypothetical protein
MEEIVLLALPSSCRRPLPDLQGTVATKSKHSLDDDCRSQVMRFSSRTARFRLRLQPRRVASNTLKIPLIEENPVYM